MTEKLTVNAEHSSIVRNLKIDPGKTHEISEEAEQLPFKNEDPKEILEIKDQMDEIIKNNDKFETIKVIMEILCKELGISIESQFGEIHKALVGVTERYYKSMEDWKNLTKSKI